MGVFAWLGIASAVLLTGTSIHEAVQGHKWSLALGAAVLVQLLVNA